MNTTDFRHSLAKSMNLYECLGIISMPTTPKSMVAPQKFINIARDPDSIYEDIYIAGLNLRAYSFQLVDFSYFQFTYGENEYDLRYAFYPNPFLNIIPDYLSELFQEVEEDGKSIDEYHKLLAELHPFHSKPLIRYDVSENQYVALRHPTAHMHIGRHSENRWPVHRILTPYAFALMVAKFYYPSEWEEKSHQVKYQTTNINCFDYDLISEKAKCQVLGDTHVSQEEKLQFFFY